jgi:hypothetical protein
VAEYIPPLYGADWAAYISAAMLYSGAVSKKTSLSRIISFEKIPADQRLPPFKSLNCSSTKLKLQ